MRYFPVVRRKLQRPPPTHFRPYPRHRKTTTQIHIPPVDMRVFKEYPEQKYRTSRAGNLDDGVHMLLLKALRTEASRQHMRIR
jgi:hypothetical protein